MYNNCLKHNGEILSDVKIAYNLNYFPQACACYEFIYFVRYTFHNNIKLDKLLWNEKCLKFLDNCYVSQIIYC